jgi:saccharopine dehydrogenase (NAD+, L-lysine-forming)
MRFAFLRRLMATTIRPGASAEIRARTRTRVFGEVSDGQGRRAAARLEGPEAGLEWTTMTALAAVRKVISGAAPPGFQTPATAFGADFVLEGEGVTRQDLA